MTQLISVTSQNFQIQAFKKLRILIPAYILLVYQLNLLDPQFPKLQLETGGWSGAWQGKSNSISQGLRQNENTYQADT